MGIFGATSDVFLNFYIACYFLYCKLKFYSLCSKSISNLFYSSTAAPSAAVGMQEGFENKSANYKGICEMLI